MFLITLDRDSPETLSLQIVRAVQEGIASGALRPGDILPATRRLARELGISRFTAERAYEELWAEGYTEARAGSATRVRQRPCLPKPLPKKGGQDPDSAACGAAACGAALEARIVPRLAQTLEKDYEEARPRSWAEATEARAIDFSRFNLDPRVYPVAAFRKSLDRVLKEEPARALSYGSPAGDPALRAAIARRMTEHGVAMGAESIVLTDGALHGLDLLFRLLIPPGGSFLCEAPCFSGALLLARALGLRPLGLSMDAEGLLPEALSAARWAEGTEPAFLYTAPSFHNPTGSVAGQRRREAIFSLCRERNLPIVEDCFEEEIGFFGRLVKPMASMDAEGRVVYMGTFSKVLFPGIRQGWLAASPAFAERIARFRALSGVSGNALMQAALADFLDSGAYEAHVRRVNRIFSRRLELALAAFDRELPEGLARLKRPGGGYLLWVELFPSRFGSREALAFEREALACEREALACERDVLEACAAEGLLVAAGSPFWPAHPEGPHIRLSIAGRDEAEIEEGMSRLGRALRGDGLARWRD